MSGRSSFTRRLSSSHLDDTTRERLEPTLARFEEAWQQGQQPRLEDYLPDADGEERLLLLVELVAQDLEHRLHQGEAIRLEHYLQRYPQLHELPGVVTNLLVIEYNLRGRRGSTPTLEEYQQRFPHLAAGLRARLTATVMTQADSAPAPSEPLVTMAEAAPAPVLARTRPALPDEVPQGQTPALPTSSVPGFELLSVLGHGGMGVVYKARQLSLGRIVALKMVLHAEYASSHQRRQLQAEAEAVARLQHPNIVQIYEVGEHKGLPYLALEYCGGGCLGDQLDGTPWQPQRAAKLVQTLARAVQAAHEAGVVHRDLKPGNVLLTANGEPKITDFGLAKRLDTPGQTRTGALMGTPSYMSPEQGQGRKDVGPPTDIYALGAVLYELLTGRPPFLGATVMETVRQVIDQEPVSVRRLQPRMPRDLETICMQCLHKEPHKRYATAAALAEDLHRFGAREPVAARPVGPVGKLAKWARRRPAVATLLVLLVTAVATGAVGMFVTYSEALRQRDRAEAEATRANEKADEAETQSHRARAEAIRADEKAREAESQKHRADQKAYEAERQAYFAQIGRAVAQLQAGDYPAAAAVLDDTRAAQRGWEYGYLRRRAAGSVLSLLGHTAEVLAVCYSPDGASLASASRDGSVRIWDVRSGVQTLQLEGHTGSVFGVCYSPDGQRIATASADQTARLWDARTGRQLAVLSGHTKWVTALCFSPDGAFIATASRDGSARLWDAHAGKMLQVLGGHQGPLNSIAYSPDGTRLVTASDDKTARVWDASSGEAIFVLPDHGAAVRAVCYSPDGQRIATACQDGSLHFWNAHAGVRMQRLQGPPNSVNALCFSPDATHLASAQDHSVRVWDVRTAQEQTLLLRGHSGKVNAVCYSPDGMRLASASDDRTVRVWDACTAGQALRLHGHTDSVTAVAFSPDSTRLASASVDCTVRIWDTHSAEPVLLLRGHTKEVTAVCYSPNGARLATASRDHSVRLWDAGSGIQIRLLDGQTSLLTAVCFSPDGLCLASGATDGTISIWDADSGTLLRRLHNTGAVHAVCYSPDGSHIAMASGDNAARIWDVATGAPILELRGHSRSVSAVCYSPDGAQLATGCDGGTVGLWDAATGGWIQRLRGPHSDVAAVCFSPDGSRLATASQDGTVRLWDVHTGTETAELDDFADSLNALGFSPDGSRIAAGCQDGTVALWDCRTTAPPLVLRGHTEPVRFVCYSPDSTCLATASADATVRLWDVSTGRQRGLLRGHTDLVLAVCFSPDGKRIATGSYDNTVRVWDAATAQQLFVLRGHKQPVEEICFSADGRRIGSYDGLGHCCCWDAIHGTLLPHKPAPQPSVHSSISPDGQFVAVPDDELVRLYRRRPETGSYDPWREDHARCAALAPGWHTDQAATAEERKDWFAAAFHRCCLAQLRPADRINRRRLVDAAWQAGRWPEALASFDHLLADQASLAPLYLQRALLRRASGDRHGAEVDLLCGLVLASHNRVGWLDYANEESKRGDAAADQEDWEAAQVHFGLAALWRPGRPVHPRNIALAALAAGDRATYRRQCQRLCVVPRDCADLRPLYQLSTSLAGGLSVPANLGTAAGPLAIEKVLRDLGAVRGAYAAATAALVPDSGVDPQLQVAMARAAVAVQPQTWDIRQSLGAALYRAGQYAEAVQQLRESIELEAAGGSLCAHLYLALAYQRLGQTRQARLWRSKALDAAATDWRDRVLRRQLLAELDRLNRR